jgi:hypothetical protein
MKYPYVRILFIEVTAGHREHQGRLTRDHQLAIRVISAGSWFGTVWCDFRFMIDSLLASGQVIEVRQVRSGSDWLVIREQWRSFAASQLERRRFPQYRKDIDGFHERKNISRATASLLSVF